MKKICLIPPPSEWGILVTSLVLQIMKRIYGGQCEFTISSSAGWEDGFQQMLTGRPSFAHLHTVSRGQFDEVMCVSDSTVDCRHALSLGASGLVFDGGSIVATEARFSHILSAYFEGQPVISSLPKAFHLDDVIFPNFYTKFSPKMHDRQGVSIANDSLRMAVKSKFFETGRLWHVPVRKSLVKRIEESRTVCALVTDDPVCAWGCASGGGRALLLRSLWSCNPVFGFSDMVEEEILPDGGG